MRNYAISDEQLNSYVDQQLTTEDRAEVLAAIKQDPQLSRQVHELQELKEWVCMAYQQPPEVSSGLPPVQAGSNYRWQAVAASVLLLVGGLTGWLMHTPGGKDQRGEFYELAQVPSVTKTNSKVLIHISKMDQQRITLALDKAEQLLNDGQQRHKPLQLEIIANAEGLGLLREGSPFGKRIESIAKQHDNIAFLACGIAMQNVRLSEGIDEVKLLPQAQPIDAALEQILRRLKAGWAYVRG